MQMQHRYPPPRALLVLLSAAFPASALVSEGLGHLAGDGYTRLREARRSAAPALAPPGALEVEHGFDVLRYELFLQADPDTRRIVGAAGISVRGTAPSLDEIGLHLADLQVDTLRVDGAAAEHASLGDSLRILLPQPLASGDTLCIDIAYSGEPSAGLYFRSLDGEHVVYTYNAPYDARHWFPCWDLPGDKARARITVRADENHHVYANGTLVGVTPPRAGERTWVWEENHAIATYLISVAIGPYATLRDTVEVDGAPVPLHHEVFPEDSTRALYDFAHVGEILDFLATDTREPYPFDKYGYGEAPGLPGAMEDQTCVTIGSSLITGTRAYEDVVAHEAAHMWFGDLVTPTDFRSVWLNEGFATYWDALFTRHFYGSSAFRARLIVFRRRRGPLWDSTPIFDPPLAQIYSSIEYEKAALVLHMLRYVMGAGPFSDAIAAHVDQGRFGHASTETFQELCETAHGGGLGWFFDEWIYAAGQPSYLWSWRESLPGTLSLRFEQPALPRFEMPLPLRAHGPWGSEDLRVDVAALEVVEAELAVPGPVDSVSFDPELWILCDALLQPWTGLDTNTPPAPSTRLGRPAPNPFNPSVVLPFELARPQHVSLAIYDSRGALVDELLDAPLSAGRHALRWQGRDSKGRACVSGVYHVRLSAEDGVRRVRMVLIR